MYTLLAYAVVLKNWQTVASKPARGHNIGSVLVDPTGLVVSWARNCNKLEPNGTQHGEVRLMRNFQSKNALYALEGYTVYTTLEPCAMCSGMMVLQQVGRTVYGQTDPDFGKAIERLQYDSATYPNGFKPYPRANRLVSEPAASTFRAKLDAAYEAAGKKGLTAWLLTEEARVIFHDAVTELQSMQIKFEANRPLYAAARKLLETVPSDAEAP